MVHPAGPVEFRETGTGATVVLAPGSCSTGVAWRSVIAQLGDVRAITTSLSGYGGTAERRTAEDHSIIPVAQALEQVIAQAGGPVHLVGHSFGGLTALAVALRGQVDLLSLTIFEAPAPAVLDQPRDAPHLAAFRAMTSAYVAAHKAGDTEAIGSMIDFYGGAGSWAAMPAAVRDYAAATTPVNVLDWEGAYQFAPNEELERLGDLRTCIAVGELSHPAVIRANAVIAERIAGATFEVIAGAAHFMIATHPEAVAAIIKRQVAG